MRASKVKVLKPIRLIDIDTGDPQTVGIGKEHTLDDADARHPDGYYVLAGTRIGAIHRFWEDAERDGKIRLTIMAEQGDPTLAGIPLPITSRSQLSEAQVTGLVCGYLHKGKFVCAKCAAEYLNDPPRPIPVYPVNILPYSQDCRRCGVQVFAIWRSRKGGWLNLFS